MKEEVDALADVRVCEWELRVFPLVSTRQAGGIRGMSRPLATDLPDAAEGIGAQSRRHSRDRSRRRYIPRVHS